MMLLNLYLNLIRMMMMMMVAMMMVFMVYIKFKFRCFVFVFSEMLRIGDTFGHLDMPLIFCAAHKFKIINSTNK